MYNVLVTTQDENIIRIVKNNKSNKDFIIFHINNVFSGLKKVANKDIDVFVYDADSDGIEVLQVIKIAKELRENIQIGVIGSNKSFMEITKLVRIGIDFIQLKPLEPEMFKKHLHYLLPMLNEQSKTSYKNN